MLKGKIVTIFRDLTKQQQNWGKKEKANSEATKLQTTLPRQRLLKEKTAKKHQEREIKFLKENTDNMKKK